MIEVSFCLNIYDPLVGVKLMLYIRLSGTYRKNLSKNTGRISFDLYCVHTDERVFEGSTRELDGLK